MDTKKIEAFLTTIETGSMNKAAEKLNYSQTGLLYMIKGLEQELNTQLLIRTPQGAFPTAAGEKLLPIMEDAVAAKDRLLTRAGEISASQSHTLYLAAYPAFTRFLMPPVINRFSRDFPDINIDIRIGSQQDLLNWVSEQVVDLAIGEPPSKTGFLWEHLVDDEIYVAIPAKIDTVSETSAPLEELLNYPVAFSGSNPFNETIDDMVPEDAFTIGKIKVTSLDSSIPLNMLENQNGIMFLSGGYCSLCPDSVNMHPLDPAVIRKVGIITTQKKQHTRHVQNFISYLHKYT